MNEGSSSRVIAIVAVLVVLAGGGYLIWQRQHVPPPPPAPAVVQAPPLPAPPPPPPPPDAGIQHPVEPLATKGPLPSLDESDDYIKKILTDLFGHKLRGFLLFTGFARNFVATVDNLAREHASTQFWPVNPTPGDFKIEARAASTVIAANNAARYAPFVRFAAGVDSRRAVAFYLRLYPLFQQAYVDLGYPGKYFNDRVVEVIDHLLETPDLAGSIRVKQIEVQGAAPGARPLYKYEDPALEARSAGQKILMRMGRDNAERLKAKLLEVRQLIAKKPRTAH